MPEPHSDWMSRYKGVSPIPFVVTLVSFSILPIAFAACPHHQNMFAKETGRSIRDFHRSAAALHERITTIYYTCEYCEIVLPMQFWTEATSQTIRPSTYYSDYGHNKAAKTHTYNFRCKVTGCGHNQTKTYRCRSPYTHVAPW